jgi:hypothetical protein
MNHIAISPTCARNSPARIACQCSQAGPGDATSKSFGARELLHNDKQTQEVEMIRNEANAHRQREADNAFKAISIAKPMTDYEGASVPWRHWNAKLTCMAGRAL